MYNYLNIVDNSRITKKELDVPNLILDITEDNLSIIKLCRTDTIINISTKHLTLINSIQLLPNILYIFLLDLSTLHLEDLSLLKKLKTLITEDNLKNFYFDIYIDKIKNLELLNQFLLELGNIRICYTFTNIEYKIKHNKKILSIFNNFSNYYNFQTIIKRYRTGACKPKALKLKNNKLYLDCVKGTELGNIENLKEAFEYNIDCKEVYCESGDAINKENNYQNFYEPLGGTYEI